MTPVSQFARPKSLREKLAQLMFVRVGSNLPPVRSVEEDAERILRLLEQCPIGGVLVFNGCRDETPQTLARLQAATASPLLVASDIERGVGQQLRGHAVYPHAMGFAALGDDAEQAVHEFAELTATIARANGIHIAFAPIADVNVDPRNPIIATRAFGSDPDRVAELVSAYVNGCRAMGLLATAKHFPGHGNTHEDSHHTLPTVTATREEMESCELKPFRAAIAAGVPLVMTAHARYPHWDESGRCATLSRPIITGLLRSKLGFQGAVVSDSLLMEGVKLQATSEGELAVEALQAGVDILLDVADPVSTLAAVEQSVDDGRLPAERVEEALEQVWQLKQAAFVGSSPLVRESTVATEDHLAIAMRQADRHAVEVATRAITCLADDKKLLPFVKEKSLCAVLVRPHTSHMDPPRQPLGSALQELFPDCDYYDVTREPDSRLFARIMQTASQAEQLLAAMIVKPSAWHRFGLLPIQAELVKQLTSVRPCVLASLGSREALQVFEDAAVKLCTFSDVPVSQYALVRHLLARR